MKKGKHKKPIKIGKTIRRILVIIFIISIVCIAIYCYHLYKEKKENQDILKNVSINTAEVTKEKTERMLQVEELKKENEEIIGWLEIEGTEVNYPVCQGQDNEYYMKHNFKKETSNDGSIFLDKDYEWNPPSSNLLLYGHNNKNGTMFQELMKYKEEEFYKEHPTIRFTTTTEDSTFEILSVFKSRVYYKNEQNVFRYYYFINAETEEEYNNFVNESKKASIYDTGKTATFGEQLLTLSTCEYSQENGRLVVVAKKIK